MAFQDRNGAKDSMVATDDIASLLLTEDIMLSC